MTSLAPAQPTSMWQRLRATIVAFAEAAETNGSTYHNERIAHLERRLGRLEHAVFADASVPAAQTPGFAS